MTGLIIKGVGGAYTVSAGDSGTFVCTARGVFRKIGVTPLVGDRVAFSVIDSAEKTGMLLEILPRRNELTRPRAANIEQVIVTMAVRLPAFDAGLLDRYLLLAENAAIPSVVICLNKSDLSPEVSGEKICGEILAPYLLAGYSAVTVSAETGEGLDGLRKLMEGKLSLFAGQSGVGKSSLVNRVAFGAARETGSLSKKIDRGRHTTRHTEIIPLAPSGFCVDTPGFANLDIGMIPRERYAGLFREFTPFLGRCKFSDCRHLTEAGCAVRERVGNEIHPRRYESYRQLMTANEKGNF
ncbi:MAG: ribosome small subunit-dependent GTPase A [Clostridiales bacterium]|jgi:ribosome biogenesis GTPase|nr:ribosome small subunit-dependent GTPase A [Clostridiales bacterium]